MPLLDHFRPPLSTRRHWHAFHNSWATYLAADLNRQLPEGYFAEANVRFGSQREWVEVRVCREETEPGMVGAVELVTPGNKDRAVAWDAFVARCVAYLNRPVGLVTVDVVTDRHGSLHAELMARLGSPGATPEPELYASAYRRIERDGRPDLDVWVEELAVGRELPTVPLWLPGSLCLGVALEATYTRTCEEQRVPVNGA